MEVARGLSQNPAGAGAAFEELIEYTNKDYARRGLAYVFKTGTASRATNIDGQLHFVAQKSAPDFIGALAPSGRLVAFDAKTTTVERWSLDRRQTHQLETMAKLAAAGALAWFLVECRPTETCFLWRVDTSDDVDGRPWPKIRFADHSVPSRGIWTPIINDRLIALRADELGHYSWLEPVRWWGEWL